MGSAVIYLQLAEMSVSVVWSVTKIILLDEGVVCFLNVQSNHFVVTVGAWIAVLF